jgi:putative transposase
MISVLLWLLLTLRGLAHSHAALQLEVLALRHQLQRCFIVRGLRDSGSRRRTAFCGCGWPESGPTGKLYWASSNRRQFSPGNRRGFRLLWTWTRRRRTGRPAVPSDMRALIRTMSRADPLWGAPRIHGELLKLGIDVCQTTVAKYMVGRRRPPSQTWYTFLANHIGQVMGADFFVCRPRRAACCSFW